MAGMNPITTLRGLFQKYRHAVLVLLIGLALMLLPNTGKSETSSDPLPEPVLSAQTDLESRLSVLLSQISGAGRVEVLLTIRNGAEIHYQTDGDEDAGADSSRKSTSTVIVEDTSRQEQGLVRRTDPPVYQGAVVVCQGAENPSVKLAIVQAVSCATGLGTDRITVVKMK